MLVSFSTGAVYDISGACATYQGDLALGTSTLREPFRGGQLQAEAPEGLTATLARECRSLDDLGCTP